MVIEESSVVAAASAAAKFWMTRGGFQAKVINTTKVGQVHFLWLGDRNKLFQILEPLKIILIQEAKGITKNMTERGGGIKEIELIDFTEKEDNYYQLKVTFETCDSMGANFINSVLESFAKTLVKFVASNELMEGKEKQVDIIMSILSNYTPNCIVEAKVECPIEALNDAHPDMDGKTFAKRFNTAIQIAHIDPYRATTHNKGIFNGIDAIVLATGNDFRAVEACGHTFASKDGQYKSLSHCSIENNIFKFYLKIPLALGTVGGLTSLHPIAKRSLELLENPNAEELMKITACVGLAQNFAAIKSLITTGIQKGHMKMHLSNILNQLEANDKEQEAAVVFFENKVISFQEVRNYLTDLRSGKLSLSQ
jgi:hydroxymethylglutaryl-CoA reductase